MASRKFILLVFVSVLATDVLAQITNVRKWRKTEVDSLDHALFLQDEKMYAQACPLFEGILKNHPKEEFIKYSFAKCALYRSDKHEESYKILTEIYPKYDDIPEVRFEMAWAAHHMLRFDEAESLRAKHKSGLRCFPE